MSLELVVAAAHGNRDIPMVLRNIVGDELQVKIRRDVERPAHIGPEVGIVDVAVVQGLERGQLVAEQPAQVAALAEAVVGDRTSLGTQALRLRPFQLRQGMNTRAVLTLDEHITRPVVGPRVEDFPRQLFIVGNGVVRDRLAQHQVALTLEKLPDRRLVLDVEPVDAQLDAKLLGQGSRQLDVKARALTLRSWNKANWRGPC